MNQTNHGHFPPVTAENRPAHIAMVARNKSSDRPVRTLSRVGDSRFIGPNPTAPLSHKNTAGHLTARRSSGGRALRRLYSVLAVLRLHVSRLHVSLPLSLPQRKLL